MSPAGDDMSSQTHGTDVVDKAVKPGAEAVPPMSGPGSWTDPVLARTIPQLIHAAAATYGDKLAFRLAEGEGELREISFRGLDERSAELGRALLARGAGKGSRICFILTNGPDWVVTYAAIARIGAVPVPISTMLRAAELVRVLRQSDVGGLIVQRRVLGHDMAERLAEALPELAAPGAGDLRLPAAPYLRWICSSGEGLPPGIGTLSDLRARAAEVDAALLAEIEREVHPTDQAIEIYTSGSMAAPKGVRHLHGPIMFRAQWLSGRMVPSMSAQPEFPLVMPMFWVGGLMMGLMMTWVRGVTGLCTEATKINSRHALGSMLTPEDIAEMLKSPPYWGLGMSETLAAYSWGDEVRAEGWPLAVPLDHWAPGYDIRVVDEDGREVADGETGEIQVRGYPVTPALHKIERSAYFTADGFFHTGDLCTRDGARFHFVGRGGDMIKTAGANVSPAEVEDELQRMDGVHSAYVVGLPDAERGQLVVAALVAREGMTLDLAVIEQEMRRRLSGYKVPRAYVEIAREEVPMMHSNKVYRRELERLLAERLGRAAA